MKLAGYLMQLLLICLTFLNARGQSDIALHGVIVMQNSQYKTGHKEYVANANVKSTGKCIPTSSDSKGEFTLVFSDKPVGGAATVIIKKDGLDIVNSKDMEEATIIGRLSPFEVVMCKQGQLEANKEAYYLISDSAIQKIYDTRLKAILQKQGKEYNTIIASLEKELKRTIKDSDDAIAGLNEQLASQKKQVKDLVDHFAVENLDDQSETYQKAFTAFTKGDIDSALSILDKVDIGKRLETNSEQIQKEKSVINNLNENILGKEDQMHQDIEQALLDARMHKLKYQFEQSEEAYNLVLKYDSLNFNYLREYELFLTDIHEYDKALQVLNRALTIYEKTDQANSANKWQVSLIESLVGYNYWMTGDLSRAEVAYSKSMERENELLLSDSEYYAPKIAGNKILLSFLYQDKNDCLKAEKLLVDALKIFKSLAKINPDYYGLDVMSTESSLGNMYNDCFHDISRAELAFNEVLKDYSKYMGSHAADLAVLQFELGLFYENKGDFEKAEAAFKEELRLYESLTPATEPGVRANVARSKSELADFYRVKKDYLNAEGNYLQALGIYTDLTRSDAQGFQKEITDIKSDLAILYDDMRNTAKAETYYLESLDIYEGLSKTNPAKYEEEVARTKTNLGIFYERLKEYVKSEMFYLQAIDSYKRLSQINPGKYEGDIANTQNNLGFLCEKKNDYGRAELFYLQSLDTYKQLSESNPGKYATKVGREENNLGLLYKNRKDYVKSESAFLFALNLREQLVKTDTSVLADLANTQNDMGVLYDAKKDYSKAELFYLKSLDIYKRLSLTYPAKYDESIALTTGNLGNLYNEKKDYDKSELFYLKSVAIYRQLSQKDPGTYEIQCIDRQSDLLNLYEDIIDTLKSDSTKLKHRELTISLYEELNKKSLAENPLSNVSASNCGNLSWHLLLIKEFKEAEAAVRWGLQIDSSLLWIKTNLAHSLLLQGRFAEAEKVYFDLKDQKEDQSGKPYKVVFLEDLDALEKAGITSPDVEKIKKLLNDK